MKSNSNQSVLRTIANLGGGFDIVSSGELQRVMAGMAESAARTGDQAGAFGEQLSGLTQAFSGNEPGGLAPMLSQALAGTAEMRESAAALQHQVAAGRREIDRLRDDLSRARDEALIDPLSRVFNRKGFDQRLQAMLEEPLAQGGSHCLVMMDIDRFKLVNDTHGHVMGDRILQAVAEVLRSSVTDPSHCVARYGGEEFAVLLPHSSIDAAAALADVIRRRVSEMKVRDRRTQNVVLTVTISGGVAAVLPGDDALALVVRADKALYAAKEAGRDRVLRG
jgi:diguanylate cyclase